MGRSITCTYQFNVNLSNGTQMVYGAMSIKQAKGMLLSEKEYQKEKGIQVVTGELWPQTARGRNTMKKDFAIMTMDGRLDHYKVGDSIPFYTF